MNQSPWWRRIVASLWLSFCFVFVYNGCNYLSSIRDDVGTCAFTWELDLFAFIPILIIPYWSIDFLFFVAPLFVLNRVLLSHHVKRITFGIFVSGVFFLLFPLELAFQRPPVVGWLAPFFSSLENFNNFYNCAPSLHIVLLTNLWAIYWSFTKPGLRPLLVVWFLMIEASTIFCYQHHLMDVFTGQLLGLFCLFLFPNVPQETSLTEPSKRRNSSRKIASIYAVGWLTLVLLSVLTWPGGMLFLWPASSLLVLAMSYYGIGPSWLRKRDGKLLWSARVLLAPYSWVAKLTAHYFSRGQSRFVEVASGLYLGGRLDQVEASSLDVEGVLDLTAEYDECDEFLKRQYRNVPVLDLTCPTLSELLECVAFVNSKKSCYVHCSLGRGRACLVTAAVLISRGRTSVEAVSEIRGVRPTMHLAAGAQELLLEYQGLSSES